MADVAGGRGMPLHEGVESLAPLGDQGADASAGTSHHARCGSADAGAGGCAAVRAAVRASYVGACDGCGGDDAEGVGSLVAQLSKGEGELFEFVDKSRIRAGYVSCAACGQQFPDTRLYEGRHEVKVLPCFHNLCGTCLQSRLAEGSYDAGLECPLCLRSQKKKHFHAYLSNFDALSQLDSKRIAQGDFACEECVSGELAKAYCEDCVLHLCSACLKQHRRAKASARHSLVIFGDNGSLDHVHRAQYCAIHRTSRYELYCEDCDVLICHQCAVELHQHHSYKLPSRALIERHRDRIQEVLEKLCQQLLDAQDQQKRISTSCEAAVAKAKRMHGEMEASFDQIALAAECRCNELKRLLAEGTRGRRKCLEKEQGLCSMALVDIWRTIDFLEKVISRGNDVEVLRLESQLLQKRHYSQLQKWTEYAHSAKPELWREGEACAGWRCRDEAEKLLKCIASFGRLEEGVVDGCLALACALTAPGGTSAAGRAARRVAGRSAGGAAGRPAPPRWADLAEDTTDAGEEFPAVFQDASPKEAAVSGRHRQLEDARSKTPLHRREEEPQPEQQLERKDSRGRIQEAKHVERQQDPLIWYDYPDAARSPRV